MPIFLETNSQVEYYKVYKMDRTVLFINSLTEYFRDIELELLRGLNL
jgi:hypothetical protein